MTKSVRILGKKAIPIWLLVLALVACGAGAAAGTVLAGRVTGEIPVAVSQALLTDAPVWQASLSTDANQPQQLYDHITWVAIPNRYIGVVADDNTAFQAAAELAVGDWAAFNLPLKNASQNSLVAELDRERKRASALERELAKKEAESLLSQVEVVNGVKLLVAKVRYPRMEIMREMSDFIRDKLKSVVVVLGGVYGDRPFFIAAVTPDLVTRGYNASEIVKQVARVTGGGGGGKPGLAQAGGKDKAKLDEALRLVKSLI